jgi:hypothetical protein
MTARRWAGTSMATQAEEEAAERLADCAWRESALHESDREPGASSVRIEVPAIPSRPTRSKMLARNWSERRDR